MKKKDLIIVFAAAAAALVCAMLSAGNFGERVYVYKDNILAAVYPLSENRSVDIGGTNRLCIEDGAAYIADADCPDKLCVRQGKIRTAGRSIICLPNRVTVTIGGKPEADAVSR